MNDRKLIGWSIHGEWNADDDKVKMGSYNDGSFMLYNFMPISSTKVNFNIDFKTTFDMKKKTNEGIIKNDEVMLFAFSPYMHDIREFDSKQTLITTQGMLLYFYRVNGEGIVRLVKEVEPREVDMQDIYSENYKKIY